MRQFVLFAVAGMALLGAGCEYGPEHLDGFYHQRDFFQGLIDQIETKHNLACRDKPKVTDEERAAEEAEYHAWFASLTPDQKFQWMLAERQGAIERERIQAQRDNATQDRALKRDLDRRRAWRQALSGTPTMEVNVNN